MAKKTAKKKTSSSKEKVMFNYEITAVFLIAICVFVAISVCFDAGGIIGSSVAEFFKGMFGGLAYVFPFAAIAVLIYSMVGENTGKKVAKYVCSCLLFLAVVALYQLFVGTDGYTGHFISYYYNEGRFLNGGGVIGALIAVPLHSLLGVGAYIFLFAFAIAMVMCVFEISLLKVFKTLSLWINRFFENLKRDMDELTNIREEEKRLKAKKSRHNDEKTSGKKRDIDSFVNDVLSDDDAAVSIEDYIDSPEDKEPEINFYRVTEEDIPEALKNHSTSASDDEEREIIEYTYPDIELLSRPETDERDEAEVEDELKTNAKKLVDTLRSFKVDGTVVEISKGPTVTRYELRPASGVKVNQITALADDIALSLAAKGVMIAPIPGKSTIGIEISNKAPSVVTLREVLETQEFLNNPSKLAVALGKDISGRPVIMDLARMPHLLVAGATGAGKSVCINTLIISILYKADPNEVKLVMIDPKQVELGVYNGIPHLLIPVVKDAKKAAGALNWAVSEMTERYSEFERNNVRNIQGYNELMESNGTPEKKMPRIVIVIDEFADLMMVAPADVENYVCRIAQLARAAGMHLVIATQRPVVKFITGNIKANVPSRISFMVASVRDSQTILDMGGAEKLVGKGDMLYMPVGETRPSRMQCAFVSDSEVKNVVAAVSQNGTPDYDEDVIEKIENEEIYNPDGDDPGDCDEFLAEAIDMAITGGSISTSLLQRRFKIGYNRAGRIVDQMEERGIISGLDGNKPRQVLISRDQYNEMLMNGRFGGNGEN
ncbi:MAG: DNA translocase FtsK [Ruminococcaceae bacterium]|nr:DNA translocase FtsK [Oscillospiraceae bacterium]